MSQVIGRASIDLVCVGGAEVAPWKWGVRWRCSASVCEVAEVVTKILNRGSAQWILFWDSSVGRLNQQDIVEMVTKGCFVWHAGLLVGDEQVHRLLEYVSADWMLGVDPTGSIEVTSWKISLRACLVPTAVIRKLGFLQRGFDSLDGAALEMGHRYITRGAVCRHRPRMLERTSPRNRGRVSLEDELRLVKYRYGSSWTRWVMLRHYMEGEVGLREGLHCLMRVKVDARRHEKEGYVPAPAGSGDALPPTRVSVVIPTVDRYPYLNTLLRQLGGQTIMPHEIIIVDQTANTKRDKGIRERFPELPIRLVQVDVKGQCSSRNLAIQMATGSVVLFLDDDDEVEPSLIERHLVSLAENDADVSSGVADEVGAGPVPPDFKVFRISNVFPTNNTMVKMSALKKSGLFDLAYERGARADGDLGMRLYLKGALMVLDPSISVLHHHAPEGGLRVHRARVVTRASSRKKIFQWHLPAVTELYLHGRYFSKRQQREMRLLRILGTFRKEGRWAIKVLGAGVALLMLPAAWFEVHRRTAKARKLLEMYPEIPRLDEPETPNRPQTVHDRVQETAA